MKILQVYHIFPALYGGVSTVVYQITKELSRRGHKIDVLTTNAHFVRKENENLNGIGVYRFPLLIKKLTDYNIVIPKVNFVFWMKKNVKSYDCIHLHGYWNLYSLVVAHYTKKYDIPYVLQVHGSIPRIGFLRRLKWVYDVFFGYRLLRDSSKVVALTHVEAEHYGSMGVPEKKIAIIPNGIDLSEYADLPPKGSFKKKFNIPEDKKVILYLGRIHRTKGIDLLVKAYAHLTKRMNYKDVILVIAGPDDGYLSKTKSLAASLGIIDSIIFAGFISEEDKLGALVDADVFVTPSFYGFPVTFLEACVTGTPIVTTSLGGTLEWIDGKVGYVTSPSHVKIAEAIYRIISDDELHNEFSKNCVNTVKFNFPVRKVVSNLEKVYEEVARSKT